MDRLKLKKKKLVFQKNNIDFLKIYSVNFTLYSGIYPRKYIAMSL